MRRGAVRDERQTDGELMNKAEEGAKPAARGQG